VSFEGLNIQADVADATAEDIRRSRGAAKAKEAARKPSPPPTQADRAALAMTKTDPAGASAPRESQVRSHEGDVKLRPKAEATTPDQQARVAEGDKKMVPLDEQGELKKKEPPKPEPAPDSGGGGIPDNKTLQDILGIDAKQADQVHEMMGAVVQQAVETVIKATDDPSAFADQLAGAVPDELQGVFSGVDAAPAGGVLKIGAGGTAGWFPDSGDGSSGDGKITTDYVFVGGNKLTIPQTGTTDFLKVYLNGGTPPAWVGAMPTTQDSDAVVYDVTKNRIQLPGNMGGG